MGSSQRRHQRQRWTMKIKLSKRSKRLVSSPSSVLQSCVDNTGQTQKPRLSWLQRPREAKDLSTPALRVSRRAARNKQAILCAYGTRGSDGMISMEKWRCWDLYQGTATVARYWQTRRLYETDQYTTSMTYEKK